jgi:hypothetical protein
MFCLGRAVNTGEQKVLQIFSLFMSRIGREQAVACSYEREWRKVMCFMEIPLALFDIDAIGNASLQPKSMQPRSNIVNSYSEHQRPG